MTSHARFQSTPSGGKATIHAVPVGESQRVSIHAFRGEGDWWGNYDFAFHYVVSIHAFRGEGDLTRIMHSYLGQVSIHAFRGEGDVISISQ